MIKVRVQSSLFIVISAFIFLLTTNYQLPTTYASEASRSATIADIGHSRIDPASPWYFLKTVRENLEMKLAQTKRVKDLRMLEFATRRLREARTLILKNEDLIPPTLERYAAHLRGLKQLHTENTQFGEDLKNNLSIHLQVLEQIYNLTQNSRTQMAIRTAMFRIIQRTDVANSDKLPVCSFFSKEATSSALNSTEQYVLSQRAKECLQNLKLPQI